MTTKSILKPLCPSLTRFLTPLLTPLFLFLCCFTLFMTKNELFCQEKPTQEQLNIMEDRNTAIHDAPEERNFGALFMRMILMLLLVLSLFVVGTMLAKKYLYGRTPLFTKSGEIQLLERKPLSPKTALYLVQIGEEKMLIAEFPQGGQIVKFVHYGAPELKKSSDTTIKTV